MEGQDNLEMKALAEAHHAKEEAEHEHEHHHHDHANFDLSACLRTSNNIDLFIHTRNRNFHSSHIEKYQYQLDLITD